MKNIKIVIFIIIIVPGFLFSQNYNSLITQKSIDRKNPDLIRLKMTTFSTKEGSPGFKSMNLEGKTYKRGKVGTYLVQFNSSVQTKWLENIESVGGKVYGYIPNHAYIVKINSSKINEIRKMPSVQWVGRYKPAYRIDPNLLKVQKADLNGNVILKIQIFHGADRDDIAYQLMTLGAKILRNNKGMYYDYIRLTVPIEKVKDIAIYIANIEDVNWVERFYEYKLSHAWTKWIIQSYHTSDMGSVSTGWNAALSADATHTPVYQHNIYGQGQIIGISDTGADWDNVWFYETSLNFDGSGTTFTGSGGTKIIGYQALSDNKDGASNNINTSGQGSSGHGTHTSTTICGDSALHDPSSDGILARGDGIAPMAQLVFQDISTTPGASGSEPLDGIPSDLNNLFLWAYNGGARIHSNSWGSSAHSYNTDAYNCDVFMWNNKDFLILFATGNAGPNSNTIGSPSTAKDVVSVGASQSGGGCNVVADCRQSTNWQNPGSSVDRYGTGWSSDGIRDNELETMGWFSSHGPTDEGLRKPEVVAPGGHMTYAGWSTGNTSDGATADGHNGGYSNSTATSNGTYLCQMGGTSMATPATAGAAALIRQYYIDGFYPTGVKTPANTITPSAALMKATLIVSTRNMTGYYTSDNGSSSSKANVPTNGQGWGRIVLDDALYFASDPRKLEINDITGGINNGESHPYNINVGSNTLEDFKVVLVWTDYFGTQSASDPLVNDLNLTISDGTNTYRGNVFGTNGYSITGGSYDATNANEVVWLQGSTVANKSITITVSGYDINHGPQPYALVICGDIGTSGTRTLNFDRDSVKIVYPTGSWKNNKSKTIDDKFEKINDINSQKRIINKSKLHLKLSERKIINNNFRNPLDDTLAYHDTSAYYIKLPNSYGDLGWGNRFTPNYDNDTLREIWFAAGQNLSTSGTPYIYRFRICSNNSGIPGSVLDSFDVSSDDITASSWNGWDIGSFGLLFDTGEDFFVTVHPIGMTSNDTMTIIMDDGTYPAGLGRSYENYSDNSWHTMGEGYGTDYSFLFETVLGYPSPIPTDTATFYIKNDPSSTENLIIYNATDEKDTCWIDTIITPITTIPPGDSAPVNITIDTSGLIDNIYYSNIIIESNATNGTKSNNSIPILLDLNTGLHSGISTIVNKKLTSKLNLIATKNPFIHTTDLKFALPSECDVNITIYDISGKKLNELTNKKYTAGIYKIKWDGKDSNRKTLPSGFYFAKMTTGNKSLSTKIIKLH